MKRAVAYPLFSVVVLAAVGAANFAVYSAGSEWFVQQPSLVIVIRNIGLVAAALLGGWVLIPRVRRSVETLVLVAATVFGLGLAMQFRLGADAPRQLSNGEIRSVVDSVAASMPDDARDSAVAIAADIVRHRNADLRRAYTQARLDTRLARGLEKAYGPTKATTALLAHRETAPMDNPLMRVLPVLAFLLALGILARSNLPALLSSGWRVIGFYGSLAIGVATLLYLVSVGGVRGADFAPQELLKLSLPVAWAGFLLHYRGALQSDTRAEFAASPFVLWIYVLGLLTLPLGVFVVVRDFGQFLVIGVAQVLLLAWFTRSALYIVLFLAALLATSVILLSGAAFDSSALLTVLAIVVGAVAMIGLLERFRRDDALWTSASLVLVGYVAVTWMAVQIPFISRSLQTPRSRFMLWWDLYARNGNPHWWDNSRQIVEALYAFDAGGIFGTGLGRGTPFLIPKASSDFIFAAFGEELGFVGAALLAVAFVAMVAIGLRIARDLGRASFFGLLAAGYALLLGAQAFVHIAGTMNILPMTGITLPMVSSGTSSLVVAWAMLGALAGLGTREATAAERMVIRKDLR